MSAFQIYALILVIIYIVYYMMAILWELKYHSPKPAAPKYDPVSTFGFRQVFIFENLDGTYSLSEDSCRPSEDYHYDNEDGGLFESLEDDPDFIPVDEAHKEVESSIGGGDDDPDSYAVYRRLKQAQEEMEKAITLNPEYELRTTLFERMLEAQDEMISAVEGMEVYYSKEFLYVMNLPIDINTRVKRQIVPYDPLELSSDENYYDYQLDDWLQYARVDFSFSEGYHNLLIHLNINKHIYTKMLRSEDVRKCFNLEDNGGLTSNIDTWGMRKSMAIRYFRKEIIYEHKMVEASWSYCYGNNAIIPPLDVDVRTVVVPELWFNLLTCIVLRTGYDQYRIDVTIQDGPVLSAIISDEDIDIYLQRNEDGWYLKNVSPEQLMVKYLMRDIASIRPKYGSDIESVKDYVFGHEPVFLYDIMLIMPDEVKREAFTGATKIIFDENNHQDPYILDTHIYGFHCSVRMSTGYVLSAVLHLNEKFETVPKLNLEDLAVRYFGHEFCYLKNGSEPEPVNKIIPGFGCLPKALPRDFQVLDYPDPDIIKVLRINSRWTDLRRCDDSYFLSFGIGGWSYKHYLSFDDICNYLERDAYGKFTRRVTLENLTAKYAERYAAMVRMYKEGIPKTLITKTFGVSDHYLTKLVKSLHINKMKTNISGTPLQKKLLIRDDFAKGLSLTELKAKYKVRNYGILYKIIGNATVDDNCKIPDEYKKFRKESDGKQEEGN